MSRAAVFLDRDGVINANRADHVLRWEEFEFLPGALRGIAMLHAAGFPIVVITNQGVVDGGLLSHAALGDIHRRMISAVRAAGGDILDVLYCPHQSASHCDCRKPKPGMFFQAAARHDIDLTRSHYVGDALTDVAAGLAAGCNPILVRSGRGRAQELREEARLVREYRTVEDLRAAARWITGQGAPRQASAAPPGLPVGWRLLPSMWLRQAATKS